MFIQGSCNTGLTLGSTTIDHTPSDHLHNPQKRKSSLRFDHVIPSLTLGLSSSEKKNRASTLLLYRPVSHSVSATSSPYSGNSSMKRERDVSGEEVGIERERSSKVMISDIDHDQDVVEEGSTTTRKKLRLTKEQSLVLEDRFKEHATLNPKQRQALAQQVNLRPRQVEVWFQNRRARTKLKQTEVECEQLKKLCETLTDENKRLQNEVQGLKSLKITPPFYMQFPAATPTACPSCNRGVGCDENSSKNLFPIHKKPHFRNPFTHPSPAY